MKRGLLAISLLTLAFAVVSPVQAQLQRSEKKTLFVFDTRYAESFKDMTSARERWARSKFLETFVTTFERFDFVDVAASGDLDGFLADANAYLEQHAQELVQLRKQPDGRIGEARVTLDDLKAAVANGYAFVPTIDKVKMEKIKQEKGGHRYEFKINAHIDIYRTTDKSLIGTVRGTSEGIGGVLGSMKMLAQAALLGDAEEDKEERAFESAMDGVYEQMKTEIRKMDEFSLKAVATDTELNAFSFDLGKDFGVRMDRRYKAWSLDMQGKPQKMEAFAKVRRIEEKRSRAQVLIGRASEGDQVIEDARFGLNITPRIGVIPWKAEGFDAIEGLSFNFLDPNVVFALPPDEEGRKVDIGLQLEYNTAWLVGISELYLIAEGGWVPIENMTVWNGMGGIRKKWYFRRLAAYGTLKFGGIGVDFIDTDFLDDPDVEKGSDATVYGVGLDVGGELLLTPDVALRAQIGFAGYPKQTVLLVYNQGEWKTAQITSAGVTFAFGMSWTL